MNLDIMVYIGGVTTAIGLAGLIYCILEAKRLKKDKPDPDVARVRLRTLVAVNMGSVAVAFMGLAFVVLGLML
ncbi:hypothetical protein FHS89_000678 [Rubricella aquisinus]|jgi:hypothetical protein|uniref:Uncharacterized protein n=1 Tax=Rubricella aquisinus TaxID=2028108 RepID=A0A840WLZ5_9RHOB|nr:hypothetical protein [Rubricella aquisinus]MBB5514672.1 hypothetical protein [Rubricella aquisinus]